MSAPDITFELLDGRQAGAHAEELQVLHAEVYADPPYGRTDDAAVFADRFRVQRRQPGFVLAEARHGGYLVGYASGMPLRQGIAQALHDLILANRPEERATLTVLPTATPAQNAFQKWGWRKVARTRDPRPGSPVSDVLVTILPANR